MRGTIQLVSARGETIQYTMFECIAIQGRRKQFFSGQANQLHSYMYREFTVTGGHNCKLLCESGGMSPRKILKNRSFEIEFKGISGSQSCMLY